MGYFTETMALVEFKGDAEMAYASRREHERDTGKHYKGYEDYGKRVHSMGREALNSNDHLNGFHRYSNINDIAKDERLGKTKKERLDAYSSKKKADASEHFDNADKSREYEKSRSKEKEERHAAIEALRKSRDKSFKEAFDSIIL